MNSQMSLYENIAENEKIIEGELLPKIELWDHQSKAIADIRIEIKKGHKRIMLMMPCGSGKSRTAASMIESAIAKNKKVLFIADLKTLVDQSAREFGKLGIDGSVIMADDPRYAPWKNLQVCSAQTLMSRRIPDADFVIVDEAHLHYKYLTELMQRWSLVVFIGLSATPFTRGLGKHYSSLVVGPTTSELVEKGVLLKPVCYGPPTINTKGLKLDKGDFHQGELYVRSSTEKVIADIVDTYLKRARDRKFILFPVNVVHSKQLANQFNEAGIPVKHIDAHTPNEERQLAYEQLESGELMGLSSVGVLSKGFDETSVSCAILAFATKSLIKYIQAVWRAGRAHKGQEDFIVLDHGGNVGRLGYPDDPLPEELCTGEKTEAQRAKELEEDKKEKELLPKECPVCDYMVPEKKFTCPDCGHIFAAKSKVKVKDGELVEIQRDTATSKRNKTTPKEEKQAFYSAALGYCQSKGKNIGMAAHLYKERFGVWPNAMKKEVGDTCIEFENHMKYKRIKWAKGKSRKA